MLDNNDFKKRSVDDVKVSKSREYLWKYIQNKTGLAKATAKAQAAAPVREEEEAKKPNAFFALLGQIFLPRRIAWASVIAVLVIIGIVFAPNLQNLLKSGEITSGIPTVSANFEMSADTQDSSGITENSSFTLTSTEDYPADVIAQNLKATPEVAVEVERTDVGKYTVTPAENLNSNSVYKFTIVSQKETGPEEFTWAYQVKDTFKLLGTLPGDKTNGVPTNSGIEINFSHENFDYKNAENYFEITPAVKGKFEKHQRTLAFVPAASLKPETLYTVTLKKDFPLLESDQKLTEDKVWQFETAGEEKVTGQYASFAKDYYELTTTQDIALEYGLMGYDYDAPGPEKINIDVYKFSGIDEYIKAYQEELSLPMWATYMRNNYTHDISKLQKIGGFEAKTDKTKWQRYFYIPDENIGEGYYLFEINDSGKKDQALVQITDLTMYGMMTKTKSFIWLTDNKTQTPVKDAKIELISENQTYTTNNDGVAVFDTPEGRVDFSKPDSFEGKYIFKIQSPDGKGLVSEINTYDSGWLQSEYWFSMSTDRPMYKPNDTIKYWGMLLPRNQGAPVTDLKLKFSRGWWFEESFVLSSPVTLNSDNTFQGEIKLENVPPAYYQLDLYSGDNLISSRGIDIQNYVKPTYDIKVETSKNAVFDGEKFTVDIKTMFFDGTPLPYLDLGFYGHKAYESKIITTDANGGFSTEFTGETYPCNPDSRERMYCSNIDDFYLNISPKSGEDSSVQGNVNVRVFNSKLAIKADSKTKDKVGTINIQTNWVDLTKLNSDEKVAYDDFYGEIAPNRQIIGHVLETEWVKTETGEHYDFINKIVVKDYNYEQVEKVLPDFEVATDGKGEAVYTMNLEEDKYYTVLLESKDDDGKVTYYTASLAGHGYPDQEYYSTKILNAPQDGLPYFDINEKVETAFTVNDEPVSKDAKGYYIFLQMNNGMQDYTAQDSPYYTFNFDHQDVPAVYTQALFLSKDGIKSGYEVAAYYKRELKKLSIDIKTDKESYQPGDKVIMTVETKDKNGQPVNANVNLNLVDEAYYKLVYDYLADPIDDIYTETGTGVLGTTASHQSVFEASIKEGMGGCFKLGTQILMANSSLKPIEKITVGDQILTRENPYSSKLVSARVTKTYKHYVGDYLLVNGKLGVTNEHVILANNKWMLAKNLKVGDFMSGINSEEIEVTSIKAVTAPTYVYNFEVEGRHTYFADGYYVHNDKGGDGVRSDFEDTAYFQTIKTGTDGKGTAEIQLPDNITSWRVTAKAINGEKLMAGAGVGSVKVSLPVFADIVMNEEYSVKDKPILKFRAYGDSLKKDDAVEFYVTAKTLGTEKSDLINGTAFNGSYFEIPALKFGSHEIVVEVNAGKYKDAVQEIMNVVGTRLKKSVINVIDSVKTASDLKLPASASSTVYLMDAGRAAYLGDLMSSFYTEGDRVDQIASSLIAKDMMKKYFNLDFGEGRSLDRDNYQREDGGLAILPYAESDLKTTALVAYTETDLGRYYPANLKTYFYTIYKNKDANLDELVLSMFGLASMNEPVLVSLNTIKAEPKLTLADKLYIALAFEKLGSKKDAEDMYNLIKTDLQKSDNYEKALGAMLAAQLHKKDDAKNLWDSVIENGGVKDDIINLYNLGYVQGVLEYANPNPVSFTFKTGSSEEKKELKQWECYSVVVTDSGSVELKNIKGELAATVVYEQQIEPEKFAKSSALSITRKYYVNGRETTKFNEGDLVKIVLTMDAKTEKDAYKFGYHVTDILPSGLRIMTPISRNIFIGKEFGYGGSAAGDHPYEVDKQEMHFYWGSDKQFETISYYAKVVTPGEYYADPAKMEAFGKPELSTITGPATITINKDTGERPVGIHDEKPADVPTI